MRKLDVSAALASIDARIESTWTAVELFTKNRDPHGVMDMGAELQALQRARLELLQLEAPHGRRKRTAR